MPLIELKTSSAMTDEEQRKLLAGLSAFVAEALGKPEQYVMATIQPSAISMSGTMEDAAFVDVRSIGGLGPEQNNALARRICDLISSSLGIPSNRIYLNFTDVPRSDWAWDGRTFG
jgi:phenylpyruvate tautomerase PptA (4-oxalocrotonate tautomerase family)